MPTNLPNPFDGIGNALLAQVMAHGGAVDDLVADVDTVQFSGPLRKLLWRLLQPDPTKRPRSGRIIAAALSLPCDQLRSTHPTIAS